MAAANGIVAGALFLVICFLLPEASPANVLGPVLASLNPGSTSTSNAFINGSCGKTEYPDVCLSTLSGYGDAVQGNPRRLAQMAISVSLRQARRAAAYVSYVNHSNATAVNDHYALEVLGDCQETLSTAVGQIRDSLREVRRMSSDPQSADFHLRLSNAQTWMSAALSNVDTCTDEFEEVKDAKVKTDVFDKVKRMRKVTANALALVNLCASN